MDRGKRKVEEEPELDEAEQRQLRARRGYAIVAGEFWPLIGQVDRWLQQHRAARQGQEEQNVSDVEDGSPSAPTGEGLVDTLNKILRRLERNDNDEASGSGSSSRSLQVVGPMPELPPAADPTPEPEVPPADAKPEEDPPTDQKPEAPLAEPKAEASSP